MADKALQSLSLPGLNDTYVNTPLSTAPTFVTTQNYAVDDCVFYNRKLYKFVTAHSAGAWDNSHVTEITVSGEMAQLKSDLFNKTAIAGTDTQLNYRIDASGFPTASAAYKLYKFDVYGFKSLNVATTVPQHGVSYPIISFFSIDASDVLTAADLNSGNIVGHGQVYGAGEQGPLSETLPIPYGAKTAIVHIMSSLGTPPDVTAYSILSLEEAANAYKTDKNANIKIRSYGNSLMTGAVYPNGTYSHLADYADAPYGCVARALGAIKNNVNHTMIGSTGLIYDAGSGSFAANILAENDFDEYDYLLTQMHQDDMFDANVGIGSLVSTAGDGTIAGTVLQIIDHINSVGCKFILVSIPPVSYRGYDTFDHVFDNGASIRELDALMHGLAEKYHFIYLDWQGLEMFYHYGDFTYSSNIHPANDRTYRLMGVYLGTCIGAIFNRQPEQNRIDALQNAVVDNVFPINYLAHFANGTLGSQGNFVKNGYANVIATPDIVNIADTITVTMASGYKSLIHNFDAGGTKTADAWLNSGNSRTLQPGERVKILIRKNTDVQEVADIVSYCAQMTFPNPREEAHGNAVTALETSVSNLETRVESSEDDLDRVKTCLNIREIQGTNTGLNYRLDNSGLTSASSSYVLYKFDVTQTSHLAVRTTVPQHSVTYPIVSFFSIEASNISTVSDLSASNNVGHGEIYPAGAQETIGETVTVPTGAKTAIVHIMASLGEAPEVTSFEIDGEATLLDRLSADETITDTINRVKANNILQRSTSLGTIETGTIPVSGQTTGNHNHIIISVNPGDFYLVSGFALSSSLPLWYIRNANGDVIKTSEYTDDAYHTDVLVIIPQDGASLYVQGKTASSQNPYIYTVTVSSLSDKVNTIDNTVQNHAKSGFSWLTNKVSGVGRTDGYMAHKNNGNAESLSSGSVTDFIPVSQGEKYHFENLRVQWSMCIAGYDASFAFVSALVTEPDPEAIITETDVTIPSGIAYIRASGYSGIDVDIYKTLTNTYDNAIRKADELLVGKTIVNIDRSEFTSGYINSWGIDSVIYVDNESSSYYYTGYIRVEGGRSITVRNLATLGSGCQILYFDGAKRCLGRFHSTADASTTVTRTVTLEKTVCYIRFNLEKTNIANIAVVYNDSPTAAQEIKLPSEYMNNWINGTVGKAIHPFAKVTEQSQGGIITVIDDDTLDEAHIRLFHTLCTDNDIVGTYAVESQLVMNANTGALLRSYEQEGFHCAYHCRTQEPYYRWEQEYRNLASVKANFADGLYQMQQLGFLDYHFWVTPYGASDADLQELARKWGMECLVSIGYKTYEGFDTTTRGRYCLARVGFNQTDSGTATFADLKAVIDGAASSNGWVLVGTHVYEWDSDVGYSRFAEMVTYAKNKGLTFKTLNEAWRIRKPIYDFYEHF